MSWTISSTRVIRSIVLAAAAFVAIAIGNGLALADEPQGKTVLSNDGQVEITVPATYSDRPLADVLVLSQYEIRTHRTVSCTVHYFKLNDRLKTLADFAQRTWQNSDISGPRLSAPQNVKLPGGIYAMQAERRLPDAREPRFEIVTMVSVPKGFAAITVAFPEIDGKTDREAMDKIIQTLRLPHGGGEASSIPTTGPTTAAATKVWTAKNGLVRISLPETFVEGNPQQNPKGIVALENASGIAVSVSTSPRPPGELVAATESARKEMLRSNFAAKATRPQEMKIGAWRAMRFEITANVRGEDILSVTTMVETPRSIALVLVLGPLETMRGRRDFVESIAGTLEEVSAAAPASAAPPGAPSGAPSGSPSSGAPASGAPSSGAAAK